MKVSRLLAFAEFCCGVEARALIFEPLVADWQRQWHDAPDSRLVRTKIIASGCGALLVAIVGCVLTGTVNMTRMALLRGLSALVISTIALFTILIALSVQTFPANYGWEHRLWLTLRLFLPFMIPLAILPIMMLWRGLGVSHRAAVIAIAGAGALTVFIAGWLWPKTWGDLPIPALSDRVQEAMYQQRLEDDRAGRVTYPGTAVRALNPSTAEQRAERRRKWRSDPRFIEAQARQTRPRWNLRTFATGGLTIALGTLGWALGGLGRTRPLHATAWWVLTCFTLMLFDGRNVGLRVTRAPDWVPLAVFSAAAISILLARRGKSAGAQVPTS